MTAINRSAMLVLGLALIIGSALASEYPFGSKVYAGDSDVGRPLSAIPFPQTPISIQAWDVGATPATYDDQDIVYLHFAAPGGPIRANDIRLTPFGIHQPGSKVTPFDNDIGGTPWLGPFTGIYWLDLYGAVGQVDLKDPILAQDTAIALSDLNDVRLTTSEGMLPGTKLSNSDPDFGQTTNFLTAASPIAPARIEFFDRNADAVYDYPDDIYSIQASLLPLLIE